jgi:hypothetical protein
MANSNLEGKYWDIHTELLNHLNKIFNAYKGDQTIEGYQRLRNLINKKEISYEQMKRIKNFFDNHEGGINDTTYLLNGGSKMKNWVDACLSDARQDIKGKKQSMMNIGMLNQFQKDGGVKNQDTSGNRLKPMNVRSSSKTLSNNDGITECKLFGNLLKLIENNNKTIKNL